MNKLSSGIKALLCIVAVAGCTPKNDAQKAEPPSTPEVLTVKPRIIKTIPHDPTAFTQGLLLHDGRLYQSAGLYGSSRIQVIDTATGSFTTPHLLDQTFFAEGLTQLNKKLFQITWQERTCFVYSIDTFACIDTLSYSGEGWGLATDEQTMRFYMSNGSDTLFVRDQSFNIVSKVPVTLSGKTLSALNELEFANGRIYANVWFSDFIFEIDPANGEVQRIIDCSDLVSKEAPESDQAVLNGIAFDSSNGTFFVTGKNWKNIFVVRFDDV